MQSAPVGFPNSSQYCRMADCRVAACCVVCRFASGSAEFASSDRILERCGRSVVDFLRQHDVTCFETEGGTTSFICEGCLGIVVRCDEMYFCYVAGIESLRLKASSSETKPVVDLDPLSVFDPQETEAVLPTAECQSSPSSVPLCVDRAKRPEISTSACLEALKRFCSTTFVPSVNEAREPPATNDVELSGNAGDGELCPDKRGRRELDDLGPGSKRTNKKKKKKDSGEGPRNNDTKEEKALVCPSCFEQCEPGAFKKHIRTAHPERRFLRPMSETPFRCSLCPYTTLYKGNLGAHNLLKHDVGEKKHVCIDCGAAFKVASTLSGHMVKVHGAKKAYTCEQCGNAYSGKIALSIHVRTKHTENVPKCICAECGVEVPKVLYSAHSHGVHRKKEKAQEFPCNHCSVRYTSKRSLTGHLAKVHGIGERRKRGSWKCEECGQVIKSLQYFRAHMIRQHGVELPGLRKHQCHLCDEVFYVKNLFESHMMLHTGKFKHVCKQCGYSTRFSGNLFKHVNLVHKKAGSQEKD